VFLFIKSGNPTRAEENLKKCLFSGYVAHACNPTVGGSHVWGQPRLHSETLSQKNEPPQTNKIIHSKVFIKHFSKRLQFEAHFFM
jgi:hypothetical protein